MWDMGFDAVRWVWRYFLLGAIVVVPIWLIVRFMRAPRPDADASRNRVTAIREIDWRDERRALLGPFAHERHRTRAPYIVTHARVLAIAVPMTLST